MTKYVLVKESDIGPEVERLSEIALIPGPDIELKGQRDFILAETESSVWVQVDGIAVWIRRYRYNGGLTTQVDVDLYDASDVNGSELAATSAVL